MPKRSASPSLAYLDLQAYLGTTKHMGGRSSTLELFEMGQFSAGMQVLEVGCGAGATTVYLASSLGCRVIACDLSTAMLHNTRQRLLRHGLNEQVHLHQAEAGCLPFPSASFDRLVCESVLVFNPAKSQALQEFARVLKPGGWLALNEETLLKSPLPPELLEWSVRTWEIDPDIPICSNWVDWLHQAGFDEVIARPYRFNPRRESTQIQRYPLRDLLRMLWLMVRLSLRYNEFRRYISERRRLPTGLFDYLGYGLYAARKASV
jgi:ubiquinone/menaquinone biosynthesis C-methylase UbiE